MGMAKAVIVDYLPPFVISRVPLGLVTALIDIFILHSAVWRQYNTHYILICKFLRETDLFTFGQRYLFRKGIYIQRVMFLRRLPEKLKMKNLPLRVVKNRRCLFMGLDIFSINEL